MEADNGAFYVSYVSTLFYAIISLCFKKDHKAIVPAVLLTFFGFCGLFVLVRDSGKDLGSFGFLLSAVSVILIFIIQTGLLGLIAKDGHASVKMLRYAFVYGALFGIATDLGVQFELREMTAPGIKGKAVIFLCGLCLSLLILPFTYRLFRAVEGKYSFGKSFRKMISGSPFGFSMS